MKHLPRSFLCPPVVAAVIAFVLSSVRSQGADAGIFLNENWAIQSAALVKSGGDVISISGFDASGWHAAKVPSTVLAALVHDGTYKDVFMGTNLATIPTAPFAGSWWYRNEFDASAPQAAQGADLIFQGINYRANVWINGQQVADASQTFGAYRVFNVDVTGHIKPGKNVVAVEVFPPKPGDFTVGFVDWNPKPPDKNMGLFRPVKLHFYNTVAIENVFVESKIDHANWNKAELTVDADLVNHSDKPVETTLKGEIGTVAFNEKVSLGAGEKRTVKITPANHQELALDSVHLWWPWELGEPYLYKLKLSSTVADAITDHQEIRFGIREVSDYMNDKGYRGYMVNGKKILIRGGGWADNLLLDEVASNLNAQLDYTKAMNLNTIRLEGIWGSSQQLYDLADEKGLLVMVGWSCQWEWADNLGKKCDKKYGGFQTEADMTLATNYFRDQVLWLRNHPAIFVWVVGSDMLPKPELEKRYRAMLPAIDPTRPVLISCARVKSDVSGSSGVKMEGPYDYVTPNYWYLDREHGGAYGFNTETGPGPQPPPLETLKTMFPADALWPVNRTWNFHCGRGKFDNINRYLNAFTNRYGASASVEEFAFKAQAANYEAMRPMYESFAVNLPDTTGIVQWMLNASWPKLYWQLYDYNLFPSGAFFAVRKGAAPLAIIYNYGDQGIYLANQTGHQMTGLHTIIKAYDLNSKKFLEKTVPGDGVAYGSQKIADLSDLKPETTVYFVDLSLQDADGKSVAENFYWLSTKPDVLDEEKSEWYVTPNKSFSDFTSLGNLPETTVRAHASYTPVADGTEAEVTLTNESDHLAFFIESRIVGSKSQQTLLPVLWDDNYVSILPGAHKTIHAHLPPIAENEKPELRLQGWNVRFDGAN